MSVNQKEKKLFEILKKANIPETNLMLQDALGSFEKSWWKDDKLQVVRNYILLLCTVKELNEVLVALREERVGDVRISSVDHTKRVALQKEVRILAMKSAKEKAQYLLEAVGQKAGKALQIHEVPMRGLTSFTANVMYNRKFNSVIDNAPSGELSFKKIEIKAEVSATFEIL